MSFSFPVDFISEGMANIVIPNLSAFKRGPWDYAPSRAPVFYNPLMKPCRDVAVLVLQSYQSYVNRDLKVSEPLAGCGVRGIRFAKEVKGVNTVYINDINERAYELAKYNVQLNNLNEKVFVSNEDACLFLSRHAAPAQRFDFIDIDPFGSPAPYIDSAVRALRDGGLLALTATDLASLCGVYPKVALRKYGGSSLKTEYAQEIAVRLLAGCLANIAAKHDIGVKILFSHVAKHCVRLYALIEYGAKKADRSLDSMGYLLHCFKCFHREAVQGILSLNSSSRCPECGSPLRVAGPLWLREIVDKEFFTVIEENMKSVKHIDDEVIKLISLIKEETDAPITYYVTDKICEKIKAPTPPIRKVINNIKDMGFRASRTHFHSKGIKTDAPSSIVIEAVKKAIKRRNQ
ncbi:MAG: tRNA (guanine(10)-N(2))-dimethyltransferase [Candidatus Bathyarchaeia archaeon]